MAEASKNTLETTELNIKAVDCMQVHKGNKNPTFDHDKINAVISEHPKLKRLRITENEKIKNFVDLPQKLKVDQCPGLVEISIESNDGITIGPRKVKMPDWMVFNIITFNPQSKKGVLNYGDITTIRIDHGFEEDAFRRVSNRILQMTSLQSFKMKNFYIESQKGLKLWAKFFAGLVEHDLYKTLEKVQLEPYPIGGGDKFTSAIESQLEKAFEKCTKVEEVEIKFIEGDPYEEDESITYDEFGREVHHRENKWGPGGSGWMMFDWP